MNKIICKHVPETLLKKEAAKNHFRRFGSVKRIGFRTASRIITVEYNREEAVDKVLKDGNVYDNKTFSISKEPSSPIMAKAHHKKTNSKKDPMLNLSDEVMAELDAMGGGPSLVLAKKINPRQEVLTTDQPKKALKRRGPIEKGITKKAKSQSYSKSNEYQELLEILDQCAITIEDKYKVLDARDKILRMVQKKNGTKNGFTRGTCPDMCPEKERLLRVIQHQVSYFEQNSMKEMDPSLAVKQYSRSSADQESPLPHDLRPVNVLQRTMSFLTHIMNSGDSPYMNIGEWFHFLWDRTRSIRKDITQQELCCRNSVQLLEQCARFHIHCSARLVSEDPSVFDQKINTENLTKCLQTLKYMYNDLRLKGETCPNEAEFRAYIILLNLNDGNFMWEVQRLPVEIQQSPQIKKAIQLHSALTALNFVKFFKLVDDSSSYLEACIMMRYFMQVRIRALDMILKCYTPRFAKIRFPLETLKKNLGFESVQQTMAFLQLCGLEVDTTNVVLDKSLFVIPDLTYTAIDRSVALVESKKKNLSLAQVVCGGEVPNYHVHVPHSSFNDEGYLENPFNAEDFSEPLNKEDPLNTVDTLKMILEKPRELPKLFEESSLPDNKEDKENGNLAPQNMSPPREKTDNSTNTFVESIHDNKNNTEVQTRVEGKLGTLFSNNTPTFENMHFQNIFGGLPKANIWFSNQGEGSKTPIVVNKTNDTNKSDEIQSRYFNEWIIPSTQVSKELPTEEFVDAFFSKPPSPLTKQNISFHQSLSSNCTNYGDSISTDEDEESEQAYEVKEVRYGLKITEEENKFDQIKKESPSDMGEIKSTVESMVFEMVEKVSVEETFSTRLEHIKSKILRRKISSIIFKWRHFVLRKRKIREMQQFTCGWMNKRILEQQVAQFGVESSFQSWKMYSGSSPLIRQENKKFEFKELPKTLSDRYMAFCSKKPKKIYWKCIISIPSELEIPDHYSNIINQKIRAYFNMNTYEASLKAQKFHGQTAVRFCINMQSNECYRNNDTNGIIFIAKNLNNHSIRRIYDLFRNNGVNCRVPVVFLLEEMCNLHYLKVLLNNGIISAYQLMTDCTSTNMMNYIEKGLEFLAEKVDPVPPIEVDYLESVLFRNFLYSEFWKRVTCYGIKNPAYGRCLQNPNIVIQLYNDGLKRIKSYVLDKSCYEYTRFPLDFKQFEELPDDLPTDYKHLPNLCNDLGYSNFITTIFDRIMPLKTFSSWPPKNEGELSRLIFEFACDNFAARSLEIYHKLLENLTGNLEKDPNNIGSWENVMWSDLMDILTAEKYRSFHQFLSRNQVLNSWLVNFQVIVVYHKPTMSDFLQGDWFYITNPIIEKNLSYDEQATRLLDNAAGEPSKKEIAETIWKVKGMLKKEKPNAYSYDIEELHAQFDDLSESIEATRRFNEHFSHLM